MCQEKVDKGLLKRYKKELKKTYNRLFELEGLGKKHGFLKYVDIFFERYSLKEYYVDVTQILISMLKTVPKEKYNLSSQEFPYVYDENMSINEFGKAMKTIWQVLYRFSAEDFFSKIKIIENSKRYFKDNEDKLGRRSVLSMRIAFVTTKTIYNWTKGKTIYSKNSSTKINEYFTEHGISIDSPITERRVMIWFCFILKLTPNEANGFLQDVCNSQELYLLDIEECIACLALYYNRLVDYSNYISYFDSLEFAEGINIYRLYNNKELHGYYKRLFLQSTSKNRMNKWISKFAEFANIVYNLITEKAKYISDDNFFTHFKKRMYVTLEEFVNTFEEKNLESYEKITIDFLNQNENLLECAYLNQFQLIATLILDLNEMADKMGQSVFKLWLYRMASINSSNKWYQLSEKDDIDEFYMQFWEAMDYDINGPTSFQMFCHAIKRLTDANQMKDRNEFLAFLLVCFWDKAEESVENINGLLTRFGYGALDLSRKEDAMLLANFQIGGGETFHKLSFQQRLYVMDSLCLDEKIPRIFGDKKYVMN
ncbi:MAG: hypothetical protein LBM02_01555 [Lachnospiraceae bacterium]|jgi:hypothetical protein|nr:hypothetical protein [Lachnospiraceae bacterium]